MNPFFALALGTTCMAVGYEIRDRIARKGDDSERSADPLSVILWSAWIPLVVLGGVT